MAKVISYRVGEEPKVEEAVGLEGMQAIVGGLIEKMPPVWKMHRALGQEPAAELTLFCNEEGRLQHLAQQTRPDLGLRAWGNLFIARRDDDGNTVDVSENDIANLLPGLPSQDLVDVSSEAHETGFSSSWKVLISRRAHDLAVKVPEGCEGLQDERGRLHDVLWMLRSNARRRMNGTRLEFELMCVTHSQFIDKPKKIKLRSVSGPGDDMEPQITIIHPEEQFEAFEH